MLNLGDNVTIHETDIVAIFDLAAIFKSEKNAHHCLTHLHHHHVLLERDIASKSLIVMENADGVTVAYSHLNASTLRRRLEKAPLTGYQS